MSVCAVVVTHNRRAQLVECLAALRAQARPPERVLVIDNASTDGTAELLREQHPEVDVVTLETNQGSAGGFHEGLHRAHVDGFDWVWLMDDDTIPAPACLKELLDASERVTGQEPALLSSKVVWTDGRLHPMNYQGFERARTEAVIDSSQLGLMPLRTATYVSLLVNRQAIDTYGLPLRRYFLWSDDIEYTARILRRDPGYLVPASVSVHKTNRPHTSVSASGERFYFHVRNTLYMLRGTAWRQREKPPVLFLMIASVAEYLHFNHFSLAALRTVFRGVRDGCRPGAPTPAHP